MSEQERVVRILSDVLQCDPKQIDDSFDADSSTNWDSMAQISIVMELEEEFGKRFSERQIAEMFSYKSIMENIKG